ncbi:hypothetical protein DVA86_28855 [Streptomyces armeniacus]|uniref:Uncharacterized protein n=1 Tax=Streptomyces armeniacus TaxID=83291 RepID=A0A345XWK6_9ACTN|nr:HGxxPAAW family protein [Streptomyces armeniacus]AXK36022.1 hypothetical protein DVA86_28855 [Streptomyces armeniacus]
MAGNNHGHTLAAWTGVTITFLGFCIGGAFTVMAQPLGVAAGCAVALLGGVVGLAMRAAGLGQKPQPQRQPQPRASQEPASASASAQS